MATAALLSGSPALAANLQDDIAQAGSMTEIAAAASLNSQDQDFTDVDVYGVRGRTMDGLATGSGSYEVIRGSVSSASLTPGACSGAGFPGGWCNTAHSIAASAFGWDFHVGGAGVTIGIVDTGIDLNNPEFTGRVLTGTCIVSSVNPCTLPDDQVGGDDAIFPGADSTHGTHVAGIAAGTNTGIAYLASILPVKVCGSNADSCIGVDQGIVWASQHGASIISVSIGGPILAPADITAFQAAIANGSLLVVAGGNGGNKNPSSGFLAGAALKQGIIGSMIVVGATGCNGPNPNSPANCANGGKGGVASFSQVPSTQCQVQAGQRVCLEDYFVVAPGVDIWSSVGNGTATGPNYGYLSGTSMATPYVSGVAAVIKGNWPTLTSSQIASIIFQTTDDIGAPGIDPIYGRGEVDITKALSPVGAAVVVNSGSGRAGKAPNMSAITAAVGGGQATASALSHFGVAGATNSLASGAFAVAVQNSTILKNAVVVDSFGRTFHADLTRSTYTEPMVDLTNYMHSNFYQQVNGFGSAVDTPLGVVSASGYAVGTTTPALISSEYIASDRTRYDLRDFSMSLGIASGVALQLGYNTQMSGRFNSYDARSSAAYDGLFFSAAAVNSPYLGLTDGGNYIGTEVKVSDSVRVSFGASSMTPETPEFQVPDHPAIDELMPTRPILDRRNADATMATVNWDFANWGGVGMSLTQTDEHNGLLGGFTSGALSVSRMASTTAAGFSGRVGFGDGWVSTLSYSQGVTHVDLRSDSLVTGMDTLYSSSYGVAISKKGVLSDVDSIGLALTRPIHVYQGGVNLAVATDVNADGDLLMSHEHVSLSSATPETDLEAGYMTSYLNGALSLQANAAYQMNVDGRTGTNAVTFLSRVNFNF